MDGKEYKTTMEDKLGHITFDALVNKTRKGWNNQGLKQKQLMVAFY